MQPAPSGKRPRIEVIDVARGIALLAMAVYHFAWDLEFFGYAEAGTMEHGGWRLFARADASSFLFLVGVSLLLAHGRRIRWRPFATRLVRIGAAAGAISLVTWYVVPSGFIFFGILHEIALASVLGLAFLRLPAIVTLIAAGFVVAAPHFLRTSFFDHPAWWWVGLSSHDPPSNDYVPLFPWFAAVLAGIALARLARDSAVLTRLARLRPGAWARPADFAGRHSLAFYLIHQPVLIASVWVFAQIWPPATPARDAQFTRACMSQCVERRDAEFCRPYCVCALNIVESEGRLERLFDSPPDTETRGRMGEIARTCTARIERRQKGEGHQ